jgi:glycosyltransferase involved in cell wall biosynthesis
MPRFTIGIPTYNRAGFLRRALETALDQTHPDVEVLVSDDASTDATQEVVRSFGGRVRYHRNAENIGSWPNFVKVTELASGDYFSWLQDDDLVHRDFARRATQAMDGDNEVAVYAAYEVVAPSAHVFDLPLLYGPPISLDWMRSELRTIDGSLVAPLSFFVSFVNPPSVAFRTSTLRKAVEFVDPECPLFNERIVVARAAAGARVAVDPWPGAIFFNHDGQDCRRLQKDPDVVINQWFLLTEDIGSLLAAAEGETWKSLLKECLDEMALQDRLKWARYPTVRCGVSAEELAALWQQAHPIAREARSMLLNSLPESERQEFVDAAVRQKAPQAFSNRSRIKEAARLVMPPLAWNALRSFRKRLHSDPL